MGASDGDGGGEARREDQVPVAALGDRHTASKQSGYAKAVVAAVRAALAAHGHQTAPPPPTSTSSKPAGPSPMRFSQLYFKLFVP